MRFAVYQTSRIGARNYNQDRVAHAYTNDALLLVLADGMGGHSYGDIAAQIVIDTFMRAFVRIALSRIPDPAVFLRETMHDSHEAIIHHAGLNQLEGSPGTTCVAALVQDGEVTWAHAGDSRFYLLRDQNVNSVSRDHSVVQQLADLGRISEAEMGTHPERNKITNCLGGVGDIFYVDSSPTIPVQPGDVLLLCSDGLWGPLANSEIADAFAGEDLPESLERLVDVALLRDQGRADNTTAVVARLGASEDEHKTDMPVCRVFDCR
jgi:serine/threonine protein phosphatase PrpC